MATMKYIGARYMPKFTGLYNATTEYEALSVVDNGSGTSYVSNKPVPAGTPLTDTDYWAVYGASSGAILDLQNRMSDAENSIGDIESDITDINNDISDINEKFIKRWILLSDSYGLSPTADTSWQKYLIDYTGLSLNDTVYRAAIGGSCFGLEAYSFTHVLESLDAVITDKTKITDILVAGGINDRLYTKAAIISGIDDFVSYVSTHYPNAKIHLATIGLTRLNGELYPYYMTAVESYKLTADRLKIDYVSGSEYIFNDFSKLNPADWIHPIQEGSQIIARGLANWMKTGTVSIEKHVNIITFAHNTAIISSGDVQMYEYDHFDSVFLFIIAPFITFSSPQASGLIEIGTIVAPHFVWGHQTFITFNAPCILGYSGGSVYANAQFHIQNGKLYLQNDIAGLTTIGGHNSTLMIPKTIC